MYLSQQDSTELEEKYYCPCKDVHASHICLHSFYIIASTVGYVNFRLVLAKGICLLPLQRLNSMLLQLLTFHTPWRGFRVESDALCAPGKLVEQVFRQIFSGTDFIIPILQFNLVQSLSRVQLFVTPWTAAHKAFLSFTISQSLLKFMPIESVKPHPTISSSVVLCCSNPCISSYLKKH